MKEKELGPVEEFFARMFWQWPWTKWVLFASFWLLASVWVFCFGTFIFEKHLVLRESNDVLLNIFFVFVFFVLVGIAVRLIFDTTASELPEYKAEKIQKRAGKMLRDMIQRENQKETKAFETLLALRESAKYCPPEGLWPLGEWMDKYERILAVKKYIKELQKTPQRIEELESEMETLKKELF